MEHRSTLLIISDTHQLIQQLSKYCSYYPVTIIALRSNAKHSRSVVHSVNTVQLTAVQRAFCKRLSTEPTGWVSINTYCKTLQQITCIPVVCFLSGTTAGLVCACFKSSPQQSTFLCVSYIHCAKCTVFSLLPFPLPNTEHTLLHTDHLV